MVQPDLSSWVVAGLGKSPGASLPIGWSTASGPALPFPRAPVSFQEVHGRYFFFPHPAEITENSAVLLAGLGFFFRLDCLGIKMPSSGQTL